MRIKSCIGKDMADAMNKVRAELGENAIIISSFDRADGSVELRAASDSPLDGNFDERLKARLDAETMPAAFGVQSAAARRPQAQQNWNASQLREVLIARGIPDRLRESLISTSIASERPDITSALSESLNSHFLFSPLPVFPQNPVMFMGPPGSGKTSLWTKAATRCVLADKPPVMITLDSVRTGAAGQAAALAALLGQRSALIKSPQEISNKLVKALNDAPGQSCFIDTPSANPYDLAEMELLAHYLARAEKLSAINKVLVMDASTGGEDALDQASAFAALGVKTIVLTKLDTVRRPGGILGAIFELGLTLGAISRTPYFADGLEVPGADMLAQYLLEPHERPKMAQIGEQTLNNTHVKAYGS
jgi:flagellar biosynthesis protein FlhF